MYLASTAIGGLMHEHQLILRVLADMGREVDRLKAGGEVDVAYIFSAVDFIRTYADRCHHGKEEDILFRDLATKELSPEDAESMNVLIQDHRWARERVAELVRATEQFSAGDDFANEEVQRCLAQLVAFYPDHIGREDHSFFARAGRYFDHDEMAAMSAECAAFERGLIHEKYAALAADLEQRHQ